MARPLRHCNILMVKELATNGSRTAACSAVHSGGRLTRE
jgi:hypothetical protein